MYSMIMADTARRSLDPCVVTKHLHRSNATEPLACVLRRLGLASLLGLLLWQ